jgi:carbonic anhydrase/acetyltransferase-like protein (isoleucine patch superfamily)
MIIPINRGEGIITPELGVACWLAPSAAVIGQVRMGALCTVWFNAVVRGDVCRITIGEQTNIQDGAVLHGTWQKADLTIGNRVSIAHNATVHGCTIEDECLIGMNAVVLDGAVVSRHCIVAAGAVVAQGMVLESGYVYAGVPAKKIKPITEAQLETIRATAERYVMYASFYGTASTQ